MFFYRKDEFPEEKYQGKIDFVKREIITGEADMIEDHAIEDYIKKVEEMAVKLKSNIIKELDFKVEEKEYEKGTETRYYYYASGAVEFFRLIEQQNSTD